MLHGGTKGDTMNQPSLIPDNDWREDISEHDRLSDLDPKVLIEYLRDTYYTAAMDLCKQGRHPNDIAFGDKCMQVCEALQAAVETLDNIVVVMPQLEDIEPLEGVATNVPEPLQW